MTNEMVMEKRLKQKYDQMEIFLEAKMENQIKKLELLTALLSKGNDTLDAAEHGWTLIKEMI